LSEFQSGYLEIESYELVRYLLKETGQENSDTVNPAQLLGFLKLDFEIIDIKEALAKEISIIKQAPRAVLSFPDKIIVLDNNLQSNRHRFSVLHEIAHYVLPTHQNEFYICDDKDLNPSTQFSFEREANDFAADLLFLGDRFILEANSAEICAATVKKLAGKRQASFEATARRLVEKNIRPCMLIVFKMVPERCSIDPDLEQKWVVHYCIASKAFKTKYCSEVSGEVPPDVALQLTESNRDISDSIHRSIPISFSTVGKGINIDFDIEYFYNKHNIFAFLIPN
jgi:hypothetical protein